MVKIHEFNPVIYPFRLWVAINATYKDMDCKFWGLNDDIERIDISQEDVEANRFVIARTFTVANKSDGWIGCMLNIYKPKQLSVGTIAHESSHIVDFICSQFGISRGGFEEGESAAYLSGWCADCIDQVKRGKSKE